MTRLDLEAFIKTVSYKPGIELEANANTDATAMILSYKAIVVDAAKPNEQAVVYLTEVIPMEKLFQTTIHDISQTIRAFLHRCEAHECDEWIKIHGQQVFFPHVDPHIMT